MLNCKCECSYASVIAGIIVGVILGVLYSFGLLSTAVIFYVYLALGALTLLFTPIYALLGVVRGGACCFCNYKKMIVIFAAGTIITAAISLIVAPVAADIVTAIAVGLSTFFAVTLIGSIICLITCIDCER